MQSSLRIKPNGTTWDLSGNTVVNKMDDTEMLFRIVIMTTEECSEFAESLSDQELHDIVMKIKEHSKEAEDAKLVDQFGRTDTTKYVVEKHIAKKGWN